MVSSISLSLIPVSVPKIPVESLRFFSFFCSSVSSMLLKSSPVSAPAATRIFYIGVNQYSSSISPVFGGVLGSESLFLKGSFATSLRFISCPLFALVHFCSFSSLVFVFFLIMLISVPMSSQGKNSQFLQSPACSLASVYYLRLQQPPLTDCFL